MWSPARPRRKGRAAFCGGWTTAHICEEWVSRLCWSAHVPQMLGPSLGCSPGSPGQVTSQWEQGSPQLSSRELLPGSGHAHAHHPPERCPVTEDTGSTPRCPHSWDRHGPASVGQLWDHREEGGHGQMWLLTSWGFQDWSYEIFLVDYKCKDSFPEPPSHPFCGLWPFWSLLPAQKGLEEVTGQRRCLEGGNKPLSLQVWGIL